MKNFSFKLTAVIYGTPVDVYTALTSENDIRTWSGGKAVFEAHPKGSVELFDGWTKGEVLKCEPGKSIEFTWKLDTWHKNTEPSIVKMNLLPHTAGTEILLEHTGFTSDEEATGHKEGWFTFVFDPLNDFMISQMEN
jgi:uncharacterized protein YndB with AHSA1/START domain